MNSDDVLSKHREALRQGGYQTELLNRHHREIILRFGVWMQQLAMGVLTPLTLPQRQFVDAANGKCKPLNQYALAWLAYVAEQSRVEATLAERENRHEEFESKKDSDFTSEDDDECDSDDPMAEFNDDDHYEVFGRAFFGQTLDGDIVEIDWEDFDEDDEHSGLDRSPLDYDELIEEQGPDDRDD